MVAYNSSHDSYFMYIFSSVSLSQTWVEYMDGKEVEFNLIYQLLVSNGYTVIHNINFMAFDTLNKECISLGVVMN